jgi:hypothetical protein
MNRPCKNNADGMLLSQTTAEYREVAEHRTITTDVVVMEIPLVRVRCATETS